MLYVASFLPQGRNNAAIHAVPAGQCESKPAVTYCSSSFCGARAMLLVWRGYLLLLLPAWASSSSFRPPPLSPVAPRRWKFGCGRHAGTQRIVGPSVDAAIQGQR